MLSEVLLIALCAMLCGAEDFTEFEHFGKAKEAWLKKIGLQLAGGIPSHDTFRKVFMTLDPKEFREFFMRWVRSLLENGIVLGQVAIDGKWLRGSAPDGDANSACKMVNAWSVEAGLAMGQMKVPEGSNEISAVPELLNALHLRGCIVTMDAAHCQVKNTQIIIAKKADYVLSAKENQATLCEELATTFREEAKRNFDKTAHTVHETMEEGHGRRECRKCEVITDPIYIKYHARGNKWKGLSSVVRMTRERWTKKTYEKCTTYYISSLTVDAKRMGELIRSHWHSENKLHWQLDVTFHEDDSRVRTQNAPENLAILRQMALNVVRSDKQRPRGIKTMRLAAGWNDAYLERLLALAHARPVDHA